MANLAVAGQFLKDVFGTETGGLWLANPHYMAGAKFNHPQDLDKALDFIEQGAEYLSVGLVSGGERTKENVHKSTCIYSDVDEQDPNSLLVKPSILVRTSPGRRQAWWILTETVASAYTEAIAQRMYEYHKRDGMDAKWSRESYLRIPGTFSTKRSCEVIVEYQSPARYRLSDFAVYRSVEPKINSLNGHLPQSEALPTDSYIAGFIDDEYAKPITSDRSGQGHHFLQRGAELGFTPGQLRTAYHGLPCVLDKWTPEQIDEDLLRWIRDEFPKFEKVKKSDSKPGKLIRRKASEFTPRPVFWLWEERIPIGEITLEVGREGAGKSILATWIVAQLTNGTLPGKHFGRKMRVFYVANEDSWEHTILPRLIAAGADTDLVEHIAVSLADDKEGKVIIPRDCALIAEAAIESDTALIVFDPLISVINGDININQTRQLREALEPLRHEAEKARTSVLALIHFNKAQGVDVMSKIIGSRAFTEVSRAALAVAVDDEADERTVVVSQIKNNLGRIDLPNLAYTIDSATVATPEGDAKPGKLRWLNDEYREGAEAILSRDKKTAKPNARDWLYRYLKEHTENRPPVDRDQVMLAADEAGYTTKTINNAMTKLKTGKYAHAEQHGQGGDKKSYWGVRSALWVTITRIDGE